jgi:hypothetical protein
MRDDDIYIHRRPADDPRSGSREPRSVVRDDDMVFRRRRRAPDEEPGERRNS